jgi:hypothetical protein
LGARASLSARALPRIADTPQRTDTQWDGRRVPGHHVRARRVIHERLVSLYERCVAEDVQQLGLVRHGVQASAAAPHSCPPRSCRAATAAARETEEGVLNQIRQNLEFRLNVFTVSPFRRQKVQPAWRPAATRRAGRMQARRGMTLTAAARKKRSRRVAAAAGVSRA